MPVYYPARLVRLVRIAAAALACVLLAGCASEEPPPPQPQPEPVTPYDPADGPGEGPGHGPDTGLVTPDPEPELSSPSDKTSIAVRKDDSYTKRVLFFNDFGRPHTKKVVAQLKTDRDFLTDRFQIDDANGRRVTVECNYRGKNLRKSVSTACDAVGIPHHFREAELPKHLEVYRTKR